MRLAVTHHDMFRLPTIRSLAQHLEELRPTAVSEGQSWPRRGARCAHVPARSGEHPAGGGRSCKLEHDDDLNAGSIAVVGMAGRFPAARSASELWTMLSEGLRPLSG
jgi:hypothetical protein